MRRTSTTARTTGNGCIQIGATGCSGELAEEVYEKREVDGKV